jgi:hypothetical protein
LIRRLSTLVFVSLTLAGCGSTGRTATTTPTLVVGPRGGVKAAELDVESGASSLTLRTANLGGDLYRVSTPSGSGVSPSVVRQGNRYQVFLHGNGPGPAAVVVLLSRSVSWSIRLDGGSSDLVADLRTGTVRDVDLVAGNAHVSLVLPNPHGTVGVQMAGGASQFTIRAPQAVPVRIALDGGAGTVALDGATHTGIAGGTVFAPPSWSTASDRYNVVATAGVSSLTLTHGPA